MSSIWLFLAVFGTVFCLGFQALNVNAGHYVLAGITSFLIGVCSIAQLKLAVLAQTPVEIGAYLIAGPVAIMSSMWVHRNVVRPWMEKRRGSERTR